MTTRNLQFLFKPTTVALIGASQKPASVGAVLSRNLFSAGFEGDIFPVNPKYDTIQGVRTFPDIDALPHAPDLAVVATPPETVPQIIGQLGEKGTRAAVVITAGFAEGQNRRGRALQEDLLAAARPHLLRVVGPNCLGIMVPGIGLNASFGHVASLPGRLAFVAQSGAVLTSVLDWAAARRIGFSHFVSLGDMADVDFGDMLDYLANDTRTRAILLYVEAIHQARKFMSAARAAARVKPVVVVKAGRFLEGARAAASHTGALAGSDAVYDAAFRRAGVLRVKDMQALFDVVGTLAMTRPFQGDRLAILTNGGGVGVLATDALIERGGRLADLSGESLARLDGVLPPTWSHGNPVDIIGDAPGSRYADALAVLLDDPGVDAILVLNCPTAVASGIEAAQAVIATVKQNELKAADRGLLTSWLGEAAAEGARQAFGECRIPTYRTPEEAVRAFMQMVRYRRGQAMLMETPPNVPEEFEPDTPAAGAVLKAALAEGREWLTEAEAKALLGAYRIPVVPTRVAATPAAAAELAAEWGGPVALKILSPDISHKTDVGGVALDLETPAAVRAAAVAMLRLVQTARPEARTQGFTVQPMIARRETHELIVGMIEDPQFGPVVLFGHGGTAVEVIADKALALAPLNMHLAREMMGRTRVIRLLEGYRGMPPADLEAIALTLVKVSQLACDLAEVLELDINPLLAGAGGVMALDARVRLRPAVRPAAERLAIRPYPKELEETVNLPDGQRLLLRPIRPEDEPAIHDLFQRLSPEEIRFRFLHTMKYLSHDQAARLTQIDYDRQMALVLAEGRGPGNPALCGGVRIAADPDNTAAEFAILLRSDMTGKGLGPMLMRRIIDYARSRGIGEIYGEVLAENRTMRRLCEAFGFSFKAVPDDPGVMRASLKL
ncbi:MAG: bifunctional acetate--CoA ligase family protein/GNAT family N-acetyltransferase [Desulfobacteraceae bacterium]|jgi:acetyltransferase